MTPTVSQKTAHCRIYIITQKTNGKEMWRKQMFQSNEPFIRSFSYNYSSQKIQGIQRKNSKFDLMNGVITNDYSKDFCVQVALYILRL